MKLAFHSPLLLALVSFLIINGSPVFGQTDAAPKVKKIPFHGKLDSVDASAQTITIAGKTPRVFQLTPTTKITDGAGNPSSLSAAVVGEDVGGSYTKDDAGTKTLFSVRFGAKTGSKAATAAASAPVAMTPPPAPTPIPRVAATPPPLPKVTPVPHVAATPPPLPKVTPVPETAAVTDATKAAKPKKQTFSGKVVSVDAAANTLVVHGKADQTFTLTPATKITGGTLADATAGKKVSGSYIKSPDGATLTVTSLKIGK